MNRAIYSHSIYVTKEMIELATAEKLNQRKETEKRSKLITRIIMIPISCLMLFWSFTFLLGLVMLLFIIFAFFKKPIVKWSTTNSYWVALRNRYKTTFSIAEDGMRIKSFHLDLKYSWSFLETYQITPEWLVVIADRNQFLFFPIESMKQKDVYEKVIKLLDKQKGLAPPNQALKLTVAS